ncbi:MAG: hypothetical protein ACYDEF_12850 [Methanosarcina sp.]
MNTKEAFDQSDIDRLVASAESDTIESKVENLEQEVNEIKGSIKALLMDIRETMSVLENPFQDIQGIANISSAIVNSTSKSTEGDNAEDYRNEEEANLRKVEANLHAEKMKESDSDDIGMELIEPTPKRPLEDLKQAAKMLPKIPDSKLIDPMSFYKTIVWSKDMVEKYDYETIKELVEIFYLLGYIQSDVKEIVLKLTEMLDKSNDLDNAVMDLYRLYHILHPEDLSLDSKVLDYVLNENDTVKNLWQRK